MAIGDVENRDKIIYHTPVGNTFTSATQQTTKEGGNTTKNVIIFMGGCLLLFAGGIYAFKAMTGSFGPVHSLHDLGFKMSLAGSLASATGGVIALRTLFLIKEQKKD